GVVTILGNHDHRAGADEVIKELEARTPFRVLRDESQTLAVGSLPLHVIGLDERVRDLAGGIVEDPWLTELLQAAPDDVPAILLVHRPDVFPQAAMHGIVLPMS